MKDLMMFENAEIRFGTIDGKEYFVAADVASALGYVNTAQAIRQHCKDPKILNELKPVKTTGLSGLHPATNLLSLPDVMRLIVKSKKQSAEVFEKLVFEDILPSIHKTGQYSEKKNMTALETLEAVVAAFAEQERKIKSLEKEKASQAHLDDLDAYARGRYPGFSTVHDYVKGTFNDAELTENGEFKGFFGIRGGDRLRSCVEPRDQPPLCRKQASDPSRMHLCHPLGSLSPVESVDSVECLRRCGGGCQKC